MDHRAVIREVVTWALSEETIRVVVLTGSVARGEGAFDELSDLDLELYVTDPSWLLNRDGWYDQFGDVLVVEALENPGWHPTRLVYYADGKIDFMIAPTAVLADGVSYDRPFELLVDKDDARTAFRQRSLGLGPPAAREFFECVDWFYAAAIMWAKYLARNDPWPAKIRDWDSKKLLLKMAEWDQRSSKGWNLETWYDGTRLQEWADPELVDRLSECWSGFSRQDSARALLRSLALFDALSTRTALVLGYEPFDAGRVRDRVAQLLAHRS